MPPHFHITAETSTKHRPTNQVTMICPDVNGCQEGIVFNAREVHTSSDGIVGTGGVLAKSIYSDLEKKCGLERREPSTSTRQIDG